MSKFVQEQVKEIKRITTEVIPNIISIESEAQLENYNDARMQLNKVIIQACIGGEFKQNKKGDNHITFTKKLPSKKELAEIVNIIDVFMKTTELPYLKDMSEFTDDADDIEIPNEIEYGPIGSGIIEIEKINNKKLTNYIFGKDGNEAIMKYILNTSDIIQLASIGEDLRKKRNRNMMLLIGGVALVLAGGVAFAVYKNNKNKNSCDAIDDIDIGEVDIDDIDDDIDEAPVVEID